jgi:hypothetical protein
MNNHEQRQGQ